MPSETNKELLDLFIQEKYVEMLHYYNQKCLTQRKKDKITECLIPLATLKLLEELASGSVMLHQQSIYKDTVDCAIRILSNRCGSIGCVDRQSLCNKNYWLAVIDAGETLRRHAYKSNAIENKQEPQNTNIDFFRSVKESGRSICVGRLQTMLWKSQAFTQESKFQDAQKLLFNAILEAETDYYLNTTVPSDDKWMIDGGIPNYNLRRQLWSLGDKLMDVILLQHITNKLVT